MKKIKGLLLLLYIFVIAAFVIYLVLLNSRLEVLWSTVIPAAAVGMIAVFFTLLLKPGGKDEGTIWPRMGIALAIGLTSAFLTVWFGLKSETIESRFRSTIIVNKDTKELFRIKKSRRIPFFTKPQFSVPVMIGMRSALKDNGFLKSADFEKDFSKMVEFYSDALLFALVYNLFVIYPDTWNVDLEDYSSTEHGVTLIRLGRRDLPTDLLNLDEFVRDVNPTENLQKMIEAIRTNMPQNICLPKGTRVSGSSRLYTKELNLRNQFSEVSITIRFLGRGTGIGEYRLLLGYNESKNK